MCAKFTVYKQVKTLQKSGFQVSLLCVVGSGLSVDFNLRINHKLLRIKRDQYDM